MTDIDRLIQQNRNTPVDRLALQLAGRADMDVPFVLQQVEGWQRLRSKVPSWAAVDGLHYPHRLALEQCSGEPAARHKAQLVERLIPSADDRRSMADLTGGLGVDFSFVAPLFAKATYVERQESLVETARHNFPLLGLRHAVTVCADGVDFLRAMEPVDLLFLDPARRDSAGRKTVLIEDCEPDVCALQQLLLEKAAWVVLKLSTMLDIASALRSLRQVSEVHVVSVGGECKDLLLVLRRGFTANLWFMPRRAERISPSRLAKKVRHIVLWQKGWGLISTNPVRHCSRLGLSSWSALAMACESFIPIPIFIRQTYIAPISRGVRSRWKALAVLANEM